MTVFASTPRVKTQPQAAAPALSRRLQRRSPSPAATARAGVPELAAAAGRSDPERIDHAEPTIDLAEYGLGGPIGARAALPGPERDALATEVMDLFRRTRCREVFDSLVELTRDQLLARVRSRVRFLGQGIDPHELLQDAYINIYRYPDRFDARRPGAFRAWSTTIVDNSVRRHLRKRHSGPDIRLHPVELLEQEADEPMRGPGHLAIRGEEYAQVAAAYQVFLALYMEAYGSLTERERFVMHMVEVKGARYAELAGIVGIRPEALKMVVFRARKRIARRIGSVLEPAAGAPAPH